MIDIINILDKDSMKKIYSRSQLNFSEVNSAVEDILRTVQENGDSALFEYAKKFDSSELSSLLVSEEEFAEAYKSVDDCLLSAIRRAKDNILTYHKKQLLKDYEEENGGSKIGWMFRPVSRAGIYVPGGTAAYPSSVLMTALPAVAAGVGEICMTTPCKGGKVNPVTLVAAKECGVHEVYKVGGAQAIAALAYGTESIKRVDVIAGPGNIYVTVAKKMVYGYVGIDMIAGPSEILIIADDTANPKFLAADMLSQAEHDTLASSFLVTTSSRIASETKMEIEAQLTQLPRADIAKIALKNNSAIVICNKLSEGIALSNEIAPEHLELCLKNARDSLKDILNAGAVFIGNYSPEPLGDYFAGPNHVLPTGGTAKYFSVLNTLTFLKRTSIIEYNKECLQKVSADVIALATCEGLDAHANSIRVRNEE